MTMDPAVQGAVDRLLQDQGSYVPLELLLDLGRLPYPRYEAWRCGERRYLEDALAGNPDRIHAQLANAAAWAVRLGLRPRVLTFTGWGVASGRSLSLARDPEQAKRLATAYERAPDPSPQMDLFLDAGASALLTELGSALIARDRDRADDRLGALLQRDPAHRLRPAAEVLCDALGHLLEDPVTDPMTELANLENRLAPMAEVLLGHRRARDFLVPFWRRLAQALSGRPFDPALDHAHASWAWRQALDWQAVADSLSDGEQVREQPVLTARLAEARRRLGQRDAAVALWCDLCWRHPDQAGRSLGAPDLPDRNVQAAWQAFEDLEPGWAPDWFPAWLLIREPGLARVIPGDLASDTEDSGRSFRALQRLQCEAGLPDSEQLRLRRDLQAAHPDFLALYLGNRKR